MDGYELIRSGRRSICIEITESANVRVRAPFKLSRKYIDEFVADHKKWIDDSIEKQLKRDRMLEEICGKCGERELKKRAYELIYSRVEHYQKIMGVTASAVKITSAAKRFGSCSSKNSLCFSYRLMIYPTEAIDAVVVHELAHIRFKNHQCEFYRFVRSVLPDYDKRMRMLTDLNW